MLRTRNNPLGLLLALLILFGCVTRKDAKQRADSAAPASSADATQHVAEGTMSDLGLGDNDCPADTSVVHDSPGALVREYVARDASDSLRVDDWLFGALTCDERATGDGYSVVRTWKIDSLAATADSAKFIVQYEQAFTIGWGASGDMPHLVPATKEIADTFVVLKTRKGWRIDELDAGVHQSSKAALQALTKLEPADKERLKMLTKDRGG